MKTSTEISSAAKLIGEERAIELIAQAGFDAWDFSMFEMCGYDWQTHRAVPTSHPLAQPDYLSFARRLRRIGLDCGIICNQSHAPFPSECPEIRSYFMRAIECTAEAGGDICVIHQNNYSSIERNMELYLELLPFAKQCSVRLAAENMWAWDDEKGHSVYAACATSESFVEHIDYVSDAHLVACLDIGHAEMRGSGSGAANMIHALGSRLQALHIHDNDLLHDLHQIPFSMSIDFEPIVKALHDTGYGGYFTLEADSYLGAFDSRTVRDGVNALAAAARRLADMFDSLKA